MSKQFLGVIVLILAILGAIFVFSGNSDAPTNSAAKATNHVKGEGTKKVTLLEYGDFQCPFCAQYVPTLDQVMAEYGDDITFQFRHFPLTNIHQNAFAASRAAEAAGKQGKFFEMYSMLYQNQTLWSETPSPQATFESYAVRLGLDPAKFKTDYSSSAVNDAINADMAAGAKLGVQGTPTFFINGKKVQINNTFADFKKVIDSEIAKQKPAADSSATQETRLNDSEAPADAAPDTSTPVEAQ